MSDENAAARPDLSTPKGFTYVNREQLLRTWGCTCSSPLHGWRPNVGPRCRLCGVVAKIGEVRPW